MSAREALLHPVVTLRRVMDFYDGQDNDLLFDEDDENGLIDLMLESQTADELKELVEYLDPLLADDRVSEQDLLDLLERCHGAPFDGTARESLSHLATRAHDFIDGKVYRPTRSD
jgi:hypothetical protein